MSTTQRTGSDPFGARDSLTVDGRALGFYRLARLERAGLAPDLARLPFSIKILLEAVLRNCDGFTVTEDDVRRLARWNAAAPAQVELPFKPARVILQDFTGVPVLVDIAAMRAAVARLGGDPTRINPLVPVDLVIDHSVQVDSFGKPESLSLNARIEFQRNRERYEFLRWGQSNVKNFRAVPPATGIVHQVNLEYLASGVIAGADAQGPVAYPDTLVGTDSHTTMINGLGVLGWGVGGIEAEAVMLGQPMFMVTPQVVGMKLHGALREGVTATDLTLTVTQMLRKKGVVDKFVEFFGPGLSAITLADRATIANMAPEYGATMGFFPVDAETIEYLRRTGRDGAAKLVEAYTKEQGLFRTDATPDPVFTDVLELDLGSVEPSLAGPKRPQDRVALKDMKPAFRKALTAPVKDRGFGLTDADLGATGVVAQDGDKHAITHGAVAIAAITSCTNTSNPSVLVAAGLLAKKAVEKGLTSKPWVKTSLAPGSKVVTEYLREAGLLTYLEQLNFYLVGYGCTTCIAEGTPVLLSHGTARRIEEMPEAGGAVVFGPDAEGRLALALQSERMDQGERECVTLVLQDGRELVCTPDHEILCEGARWVRADQLVPERDRVVVGLEAPLDEPDPRDAGYELRAGALRFGMATPDERARTLAFARLLGHLLGDGSISVAEQGRMNVGQAMDREVVLGDVERVTGKRPAATRYDERKWSVVLPKELTEAIIALPGVRVGRRIQQQPSLPAFVLDDRCPVAVVREFLGGVFGADGQAPVLKRLGDDGEQDAILEQPAYSQSARVEHVEQLKQVMQHLTFLLARCGVKTAGAKVYDYPVRRAASSYPAAQDGAERVEVRLELPDGLSFIERVGFRYCVDKAMRASAAAVYWRTVERIHQDRLWMADRLRALHQERPELSFGEARRLAAAELEQREAIVFPHYSRLEGHDRFSRLPSPDDRHFQPLHRESCGFPAPAELLQQIGAGDWFAPLKSRTEADFAKRYCVAKDALALPTFALRVLARRPAGTRRVFDLSIHGLHAFIAGGVAVHNCIGNSGPLPDAVAQAIVDGKLVASAVLSGNRNFEGRINPHIKANYLASPPLVVAYALAGTTDIDLTTEPLGTDKTGAPVYLRDLWPSQREIADTVQKAITPAMFAKSYGDVFQGSAEWNAIAGVGGDLYNFDAKSTYIQEPPFFQGLTPTPAPLTPITDARVLVMVGDSVTTDHISPAGDIAKGSPAAHHLVSHGVPVDEFNSYGSRRGNDRVMVRGTFANIRLKNLLVPGTEGGVTAHLPEGAVMSIFDAAERYKTAGVPLLVIAGKEYGTGSSRDWAAKGTLLLGVRAVIAESFERIHRANLVGMGVLPLQFQAGQSAESLGLTGRERFTIAGVSDAITARQDLAVVATRDDGSAVSFAVTARLDTPVDVLYYKNGGILQTVLRNLTRA